MNRFDWVRLTVLLRDLSLLRGQGRSVQIEVVRKTANGTQKIAAAEDTELQSGDIVNVTLKVDVPSALSAAR